MTDFSGPMTFSELGNFSFNDLLGMVRNFCASGKHIHPESLKSIVLKLTYYSRDMKLSQEQRDEAASIATALANAAAQTYGKQSEFCCELVNSIKMILGQPVAA